MITNTSLLLLTVRLCLSVSGYQPPIGGEFAWRCVSETTFQDPLAIDHAMKAFVDEHLIHISGPVRRLETLVWAISDQEHLGFQFDSLTTRTARQAFSLRSGNCVAHALMFVAMARYAGLDARFQEKTVRRKMKSLRGTPIYCRHLNVLVWINGRLFEVDPGICRPLNPRMNAEVGDHVALASYYNNRATECLTSGRYARALKFIHLALQEARGFSPAWVSLGVYYRVQEGFARAERAYLQALRLNPDSPVALLNLARLHLIQGKIDEAERDFEASGRSRKHNPYRYYRRALEAITDRRFDQAQRDLEEALKLEPADVFTRTLIWVRRVQTVLGESGGEGESPEWVLAHLRAGFSII